MLLVMANAIGVDVQSHESLYNLCYNELHIL